MKVISEGVNQWETVGRERDEENKLRITNATDWRTNSNDQSNAFVIHDTGLPIVDSIVKTATQHKSWEEVASSM